MQIHADHPSDHPSRVRRRQLLAALSLTGIVAVVSCGSSGTQAASGSSASPATGNDASAATAVARVSTGLNGLAAAGQAANRTVVTITAQNAFEPATVTMPIGATASWQNDASTPQSATFDPSKAVNPTDVALPPGAQAFDSGPIQPKLSWSNRFTTSGTYEYVSTAHEAPGMKGIVVVTP